MKSMIFSCKFLRVCALPVPAEGDSSAGRALSPACGGSEPAWWAEMVIVIVAMIILIKILVILMIIMTKNTEKPTNIANFG